MMPTIIQARTTPCYHVLPLYHHHSFSRGWSSASITLSSAPNLPFSLFSCIHFLQEDRSLAGWQRLATCRTLFTATLSQTILIPFRLFWTMARFLLLLIHTQSRSPRRSPYANVPFQIRISVLITTGIHRCILYFLGCDCRAAGCNCCAFQVDVCISPDLTFLKISAFNTRTIKNPNMFVRTHIAFYFVSLLLNDILQCESQFVRTVTACVLYVLLYVVHVP